MFGKQRSEVLVVGAGPTGLYAALRLAEAGIKVRVVDRHHRTGMHSYGLALHPRSLELLDAVGVTPRLLEYGRRVDRVALEAGGRRRAELSLGGLDSKYPFVLVVPQSLLEGEIESRLAKHRVKVQWNQRVEDLHQEGAGVVTEISHLDRVATGYPIARSEWAVVKTSRATAELVVGADGYHSHVRDVLGIRYESFAPQRTYAVYEFEAEAEAGHELVVVLDGGRTSALWPMKGRRARWSFEVTSAEDYEPSGERLNRLIRERAPAHPEVRGELIWTSLVQFDRRLATGLGRERVWLVGDAVHLTAPTGVQSMNSGLCDAEDLSWRMIEVLKGGRPVDVLAAYEAERGAELKSLFGDPRALVPPEGVEDWAREHWVDVVASIPATGAHLRALLARLGRTGG